MRFCKASDFLVCRKDVRAKNFYNTGFFSYFCDSQIMSYFCHKCKKEIGGGGITDFVFEIKLVENCPSFDKSVLVNRHGLSGC